MNRSGGVQAASTFVSLCLCGELLTGWSGISLPQLGANSNSLQDETNPRLDPFFEPEAAEVAEIREGLV